MYCFVTYFLKSTFSTSSPFKITNVAHEQTFPKLTLKHMIDYSNLWTVPHKFIKLEGPIVLFFAPTVQLNSQKSKIK